jgi:hypothetical protein
MLLVVAAASIVPSIVPGEAGTPAFGVAKPGKLLSFGARKSGNWSGYNLGFLSDGRKQFTQVSGNWTVQTPSKHTAGVNEYSVTWVGIGGGCIDQNCFVVDGTLIQAGTGSYISSTGVRSYFAWWEIIPGPILQIANFPVSAGNQMFVVIKQTILGSEVWTILLRNLSTAQTYKTTVAYASSRLTAEWIEERPSVGGLPAPLPSLTNPRFNNARVNRAPANLKTSNEVVMVDGSTRLATPSAPDPDHNGFNVCTYTTVCGAPSGA